MINEKTKDLEKEGMTVKAYGKGTKERFVVIYKDKNEFGDVGMITHNFRHEDSMPIIYAEDLYKASKWNVPTMHRCKGMACVVCINQDYYRDLGNLTDDILVILFHEYWHFINNLKKPIGKNEKLYWEAKNRARENFEFMPIEEKADDYAMYYLGKEKMLSGLRIIKTKLENCPDNESKAFELWEIEQRIKRIENGV